MKRLNNPLAPIVAVGAVVIHDKKVLLVKRGNPPSKNHWAIPGGKIKVGESIQAAAEREILEEAGITIEAGAPIYAFDLIEKQGQDIQFHYVIIDVVARYISGTLKASSDAIDCRWFSANDLSDNNKEQIDSNTLTFLNANLALFE